MQFKKKRKYKLIYILHSIYTCVYPNLLMENDGEMFLLVFAILLGKSVMQLTFSALLKTANTQNQIHLNPTTFSIDYKAAV